MVLALLSVAHAACDAAALDAQLAAAEKALGNVDLAAFRVAAEGATTTVSCLDRALTPGAAARVHRVVGLRAFFDKDTEGAALAFAAARAADPGSTVPEAWLPSGHPARKAWSSLDPVPSAAESLDAPAEGTLLFDGVETRSRPTARATIAQWRVDDAVLASGYLWPSNGMVPYDVASRAAPAAVSTGPTGPNLPLVVVSGVLLAGAGVSYALAYDAHQRWEDPATATEDLDGLRGLNNGLFVTSIVAATVGVGGGVTAFVVGSF